jgi:hypothetical protein
MAGAAAPTARATAAHTPTTLATFSTPGAYAWQVPSGVSKVTFIVYGGSGGDADTADHPAILLAAGGASGETKATFKVKPGSTFEIKVGGAGQTAIQGVSAGNGGYNGGGGGWGQTGGTLAWAGGGGASDVRIGGSGSTCATKRKCPLTARIVVAGGGGGAVAEAQGAGSGGDGGGLVGGTGASGGGTAQPGSGGTQTAPGTGNYFIDNARFGMGSDPGGGGGGWYGGGTGSIDMGSGHGAGAGGGSGYFSGLAQSGSFPAATRHGDGEVIIQTP